MIHIDLLMLIGTLLLVIAIAIALTFIDNGYWRKVPAWKMIAAFLIPALPFYLAFDFFKYEEFETQPYDVIKVENASYIYHDGRFINLNSKYHKNFDIPVVMVKVVSPEYRGSYGLVYSGPTIRKVD